MTQWGSGWPADYGTFEPFGPAPTPAPPPPPRSPWPLIALFAGVCAVALSFFPAGIGFVAVPVGIFGVIAGGIGVRAAQRGEGNTGFAIGGIAASVVAMALAVVLFFTFYRSSEPVSPRKAPATTSAKAQSGVALPDGIEVSFGPYHDDGGDPVARNPAVQMTVTNTGDDRPICMFDVHAVDSAGNEIYSGLGMIATLFPGQSVGRNIFDKLGPRKTVPHAASDQLKDATFEVTKVVCR